MAASRIFGKVPSRRDAHKHRTTTLLREAALDLFLEHGYDATTTDQVAARAGVSTRTFFRYFDSKDEVLFRGQRFWSERVSDLVRQQHEALKPMDAMCETLVELATGFDRDALVRYESIVGSSAALRGRREIQHAENARRVAEGLAARRGLSEPDNECTIMASVGLMLYGRAVEVLRGGSDDRPIAELIREQFAILEAIYSRVVAERGAS